MINKKTRYSMTHYLAGALPARIGDEMSGQALLLMGFALTQTAALGSSLLAGLTVAAALGGPLLGAVLDRSNQPGKLLGIALGLYGSGLAIITLSLGHVPAWTSVGMAVLVGSLMPAVSAGWSSQLKLFIPSQKFDRASAVDATTFNIAGLAGPALAGMTAAIFGAHWTVAILVACLAAAVPMAWLLPKRPKPNLNRQQTSFKDDFMAGFKVIATNLALLRITLLSAVSYMGIGMLWVLSPIIGQEVFGNAGYGGILMSVLSVGALLATAAYAKWPAKYSPEAIAVWSTLLLAVALGMLVFTSSPTVPVAAMFVAGLAVGPQLAATFAVRHREAPERSRSQVFTTGASLKITAAAAGAALAGQLAGGGIAMVAGVACGLQLLAIVVFYAIRMRRSILLETANIPTP